MLLKRTGPSKRSARAVNQERVLASAPENGHLDLLGTDQVQAADLHGPVRADRARHTLTGPVLRAQVDAHSHMLGALAAHPDQQVRRLAPDSDHTRVLDLETRVRR